LPVTDAAPGELLAQVRDCARGLPGVDPLGLEIVEGDAPVGVIVVPHDAVVGGVEASRRSTRTNRAPERARARFCRPGRVIL
jgi:hypothetical protein